MQINIADHLVNGEPTNGYFWLVFPDGSGFGPNAEQVRLSDDGNEYGTDQLTELGQNVFRALKDTDLFEVWCNRNEAETQIRCQLTRAWHTATINDLVVATDRVKGALVSTFGSDAELAFGEAVAIS